MTVYGIDLGTTNSSIATLDPDGRPVVFKVGQAELVPSVVYFEAEHKVVVGVKAKNAAEFFPGQVRSQVKRQMGSEASWEYHGQSFGAEKVSALILRKLAEEVAEQTSEKVGQVAITVPAYFGIAEKEATRRAGAMADLEVIDVVAEPVAAALYYHSLRRVAGTRRLLVYDLGGGTFDTTVICLEGNNVRVICTDGDKPLGGADWDEAVKGYLLDRFRDEHDDADPFSDEFGVAHLAVAAETARRELSLQDSCQVQVFLAGRQLRVELTRATFDGLTRRLLKRTLDICDRTVETARQLGVTGFDELLLVGGMTKTPAIQDGLRDRFGMEPQVFEPDLAVVKGAAIFAASAGQIQVSTGPAPPTVTNVLPRALGVKVVDSADQLTMASDRSQVKYKVLHLLPANTSFPADSGPKDFQNAFEDQRIARIQVFEQAGSVASERLEDNKLVADGVLELPGALGRHALQVTLRVTANGVLRVHGRVTESGHEKDFEVQIGTLTPGEVADGRDDIGGIQIGD